ncbi:protein root UVB sensitive 4 isoform X2 [Macadamia integrifolia]|uniref:protein root UVB sensitive 4 isoform X2 n=1 Tax=Macadamia integrifolia TaxID=60698 RepID=UPI001C4F024E|nr:protein root UVB sensitive 4 isoform X2 [Macadamia integrifolia]
MQSSFCITSDASRFQFYRKTLQPQWIIDNPTVQQRELNRRISISSNSLKTSYGYDFDRGEGPATVERLPVVIRKSGRSSRYSWDGTHLQLVSFGADTLDCFTFDDWFRKILHFCGSGVRNFLIPRQVHENYMDYVKWKFLHRVFSSALQVLATQAMFRAIGIGYSRSLPSAAALNWLLKDGLGRLSRCIYTASMASAFDTNLKRVRLSTSILFSLSIGIELLTPVFPRYFLLLATVANIAKQISLACFLSTGSTVHRSFAIADNLSEVSAKALIQTVCFDNVGLLLAALLNALCKNDQRLQAGLPFVVYPIFSAIDLFGIYQGLKHVHLQTLTKDRLEIILDTWIQLGFVPSPPEVSKEEGMNFLWSKGRGQWPIRIGCVDPKDPIPKISMLTMRSLSGEDFYFICMETCRGLRKRNGQGILLCLREGAGTTDIIMGFLQACHIRKALLQCSNRWEHILEARYMSESVIKEWFNVVEDSKRCSEVDVNLLKEEIQKSGWAAQNILLSGQEQIRYTLLDS